MAATAVKFVQEGNPAATNDRIDSPGLEQWHYFEHLKQHRSLSPFGQIHHYIDRKRF
jgi:predicted nucleotidyltransferase